MRVTGLQAADHCGELQHGRKTADNRVAQPNRHIPDASTMTTPNHLPPLRIAVVGAMTGGSVSVGENALRALRRLGHDVHYVDSTGHFPVLQAIRHGADPPAVKQRMLEGFLDQVRQQTRQATLATRPQLVLYLAQAPVLRPEDLDDVRRAGIPTVFWFVEDGAMFSYWQRDVGRYDHFWVIQQDDLAAELIRRGQRFVDYVPLACDPERHHPGAAAGLNPPAAPVDVGFVGSPYPNRLQLLGALADLPGLRLWGPGWREHPQLGPRVAVDGPVPYERLPGLFATTRINLNLSSAVDPAAFAARKSFVNPRAFEICACGGFQLAEAASPIEWFFEPGREVITFSGPDEARDRIAFFLRHEAARQDIAAAGQRRAHAEHSYDRRLADALQRAADRDDRIPRRS